MISPSAPPAIISVTIGRWAVAAPPYKLRTLLGSCVGVVLHDRASKLGGLAHVVLPNSRGDVEHPGKYADTAIPALISDLEALIRGKSTGRLVAKLVGGASMFPLGDASTSATASARNIGQLNRDAVESLLATFRIPIVGRDLGGDGGRNLVFDPATGLVQIRTPGGVGAEL